jgi:hypothetical protein
MPEWLDGMCIQGAAVVEETHVMPNEKARRPPGSDGRDGKLVFTMD